MSVHPSVCPSACRLSLSLSTHATPRHTTPTPQVDDAVNKGMEEMSTKFAKVGEVYAKEEVVEKALSE